MSVNAHIAPCFTAVLRLITSSIPILNLFCLDSFDLSLFCFLDRLKIERILFMPFVIDIIVVDIKSEIFKICVLWIS